ncbi:MAG: ribosomal-processing cysteine protease Prp [Ruminococcaceae bacterium]|nr:ribosomal-processing cysteine protease Prp [Oscillospiraceae bacterium]
MIKFTFFKRDGVYYGFEEKGHAGYAEAGDDIVCSAVSAMTMLIINAIEVAYASDVEYTINEDTTDIKVVARGALPEFEADERKRFAISGLIEAYFLQLNDMLEEYYDYLDVSEQEE